MIGVVLAGIMFGPPLWFTQLETGYMYSGAFIGALLGFFICWILADWSASVLTHWNHGIYEPEFRMVLIIPQLVLGCGGLYGFGWTAANVARYGWFWPDFFFAIVVAGMVCGAVGSALYVVDAHREYSLLFYPSISHPLAFSLFGEQELTFDVPPGDMSVEAFTCLLVFKNLFSFGLTFKGFDWISGGTVKGVFVIVASLQVGICALTVPMCKF